MSYRERVKNAILKRCTNDVVPWQINYTSVYKDIFNEKYPGKDIDAEFENNIFMAKYKNNRLIDKNTAVDLFGLKWDMSGEDGGDIGIPIDPPLASGDLSAYQFPEFNREFTLEQIKKLESDEVDRFRMFGVSFTLYERAWGLRGMEDLLADMLLEPKFVHELMRRITEHHLKLLDFILPYDIDAVYFADDWGSQKGLIMGPDLWRKMIKPYMKELCKKVKDSGKIVVLHCCGLIEEILGEFSEIGVDCWNTVQPELYDLKKIKEKYGGDLCFYGAISNQGFLPFATPEETYKKCLEVLDIMSGGGYILSPTHSITPDIPIENAYAIVRAARKFAGLTL
jgi:uroporphyrinogen decarboxylase